MRVCHYAGMEDFLQGGIKTSISHQREALELADIPYTTDPSGDYDILHLNMVDPQSHYQLR
ncbi:MAG: glycosyltransferase family 1 protein, partial [Candidatus Nanohaloarchaea archaeon]